MIESGLLNPLLARPETTAAVLCSLVEWQGSVPRKDYPVMLVTAATTLGTIGGGKMEFEVITRAREILGTARKELAAFDLTNTEALREGSLCGGKTRILLEPFTPELRTFFADLKVALEEGGVLVTEIRELPELSVQRRILSGAEGGEKEREALRQALETGRPVRRKRGRRLTLIEPVRKPPRLHIFGAGHVGRATAQLARFIELNTVVYDDREDLLTEERFPGVERSRLRYDRSLQEQVRPGFRDLLVIATPGHFHDLELLRWALGASWSYLGLISSKRKGAILRQQLINEGYDTHKVDQIHSPVGLNIEAETVPEIAVSILAEIILHLHRGGHRAAKQEIHRR